MGDFGPRNVSLQIGILVAGFLLLYAPVFAGMASKWWGHNRLEGFVIPLISLYLVWLKREELGRLQLKPATSWGLLIVLFAGILLMLGEAGSIAILGEFSLVAMIVGLVLLLLGGAFLKILSLPIAFLFFMLSIARDVFTPLHWPLQLLTAKMGVEILQGLGFAALLERQYIVLPSITLEVAQVCSGANHLISIVAIGFAVAYLTLKTWWSRATLILSAVAIAVVSNWARVVLIGIWVYLEGEMLHGPFHILQGMFVVWVGFGFLFVGAWGLSKLEKPISKNSFAKPLPMSRPGSGEPYSRKSWNRSWRMAMLALLVPAAFLIWYNPGSVELKSALETFPLTIGGWVGEPSDLREAIFRVEGADHELLQIYRSREGRQIQLYVAYLRSQRQGKEIVNYRTDPLHQNTKAVKVRVGPGQFISMNQGLLGDNPKERRILFWYDLNGHVFANRYKTKGATMLNALVHGRTNGALVLISGEPGKGDGAELESVEVSFASEVFPILKRYLP